MQQKNFADYMFYLLFTPLKKTKKSLNQFYIFFSAIGELFDQSKKDILKIRREAMVISASPVMLEVHGQDRGMPKLKGETDENYRTRLIMKNIIAERAGEDAAIYYVTRAFGYDDVEIVPSADSSKWAEVEVRLIGGKVVLDDEILLLKELNKVKPASCLLRLAKEQHINKTIYVGTACEVGKYITIRQV